MNRTTDTLLWKLLEGSPAEWIGCLAVLLALGVLIWMVVLIRSRLRDDEDPKAFHYQMLTQMDEIYRQGDVSEEEYRSIKSRLITKLDGSQPAPSHEAPETSPESESTSQTEASPDRD